MMSGCDGRNEAVESKETRLGANQEGSKSEARDKCRAEKKRTLAIFAAASTERVATSVSRRRHIMSSKPSANKKADGNKNATQANAEGNGPTALLGSRRRPS